MYMKHGFLLIDKPVGPTSHDVVAIVRKRLHERKIGHLGTLDPAASGLMVLAVGAKALKVVELFSELDKEYEAEVTFGSVSSTYDREGYLEEFPRKPGVNNPTEEEVRAAITDRFLGTITQIPPLHSAISVGGERAYRKARQGQAVDMPSREVEISDCEVLKYAYPTLTLHVGCSSGTYIRSLAHDLGQLLRVGAYLSALRRTSVDRWQVTDAAEPEFAKWSAIIPLKEILDGRPARELSAEEWDHIQHGRTISGTIKPNTIAWFDGLPVAVLRQSEVNEVRARKVL